MKLCFTKKTLDLFQIKSLESVTDITNDFWHGTIETINRKKMLILCHAKTGYTIFLYGIKRSDGKILEDLIIDSLKKTLFFDGFTNQAIDWLIKQMGHIQYKKTSDRKIIAQTLAKIDVMYDYLELLDKDIVNQFIISQRVNHFIDLKRNTPHNLMKDLMEEWVEHPLSYCGYELDITLELTNGHVMRRILFPSHYTLNDLHVVIQKSFGWKNMHLHEFFNHKNNTIYGIPEYFEEFNQEYMDSRLLPIEKAFQDFKEWEYTYDFGDEWRLQIFCRMIHHSPELIIPKCIAFEGENIPEDIGGVEGYEYYSRIKTDSQNPEYNDYMDWLKKTNFKEFNLELLNKSLEFEWSIETHYYLLETPDILNRFKMRG